jgi:hypothetical protein
MRGGVVLLALGSAIFDIVLGAVRLQLFLDQRYERISNASKQTQGCSYQLGCRCDNDTMR